MRRLLLVAMLVAAAAGAAQKRNDWSWGADGEDPKPAATSSEEAKKITGRSIGSFSVVEPPHFAGGHALAHVPGPALTHASGPAHSLGPAHGPHVVHVDDSAPLHPLGHGPVEPLVTGHQLRGEDRSLVAGPGDGKSEARFLGIKDKLCEFGLAYDCHKGKGYKGYGYSHHDISYVQPVQVVAVGGPIAAVPVAHKGYAYKGKGYGVPVTYPAAPPVYQAPIQPSYGPPPPPAYHPPSYDYHSDGVVNHVHTHKHLYNSGYGHGGSYGKDNSFESSSYSIDKLGGGPNPFIPGTPFGPATNTFPSSPFLNDCQCVAAQFCAFGDVIPRSNDLLQHITARNKRTDTLSTDGEEDEAVAASEGSEVAVQSETVEARKSRRRRDTVIFEDNKRPERDTMVFRETFDGVRGLAPSSSRQGFQGGSSQFQAGGPCGFGRVCCRNPVFRQQRAISTCGRRSNALGNLGRVKTNRFEQGDTEFGEYPWHGAILRRDGGENVYVCGGALIDSRHLVTAAHCLTGLSASELKVRLGEWDVSGKTEFYKHFDTNVAGIYSHPEFYAGNLQNDVAVVRLQSAVDMVSNPHISPVCLPDRHSTYTSQRCFVSGWGKDAFGSQGSFQHLLKEVDLPIVDRRTCQSTFQQTKLGRQFSLHDGMICAGGEEGKDACEGDGGSPLVCQGAGGSVELVGLVSWGLGCGERGIPGVYTNVPHYIDWIRSITKT
ncbi:serine protease filzig-like isoform X1 [Scylla paramamosain]|uniref:serine protease filzig-like isoform X1 n=1 Tax=Scylla paramamosain TaxID=85552 RepID=UPI003082A496